MHFTLTCLATATFFLYRYISPTRGSSFYSCLEINICMVPTSPEVFFQLPCLPPCLPWVQQTVWNSETMVFRDSSPSKLKQTLLSPTQLLQGCLLLLFFWNSRFYSPHNIDIYSFQTNFNTGLFSSRGCEYFPSHSE